MLLHSEEKYSKCNIYSISQQHHLIPNGVLDKKVIQVRQHFLPLLNTHYPTTTNPLIVDIDE